MKCFYDTETSGKANFKASVTDKSQPRLVQLALILTTDEGEEVSHAKILVKPDGFEIPKEASDIHGITTEFATKYGLPLKTAIGLFHRFAEISDTIHAFNIQFDSLIIQREMAVLNIEYKFKDKENCEMLTMKPICKLPGKYNDFKWPTLTEAYKHAFGSTFDGAHDSMIDVKAMISVHKWRLQNKL